MSVLKNPRFRRLLIGEAVSSFGDSAMFLSLGIWAKDLTGSNAAAGMVFLALTAPGLLAPLFGHVVDRVRRKPLLMGMYAVMALLVLALLAVRTADQIWIVYGVAVAYGVMFSTPVRSALLKDLLPSADAASARATLSTVHEGLRILSPVVGAGIYLAFGGGVLAVLDAVTFVAALAALASIKVTESEPEPRGEPFLRSVTAGFRYLRQVPLLARLTLGWVVFMAVAGLLETATFAAVEDGLNRPAAFFGVVTTVQGLGSVGGGVLAGWLVRRAGEARACAIGYACMALGLGISVTGSLVPFLAGCVLLGLALPVVGVAMGTAQQLYTPARLQGRVGAAGGMLSHGAQSISIAAGAALVTVLDFRVMFALSGAAALVCAVLMIVRPAPTPEVVASVADARA